MSAQVSKNNLVQIAVPRNVYFMLKSKGAFVSTNWTSFAEGISVEDINRIFALDSKLVREALNLIVKAKKIARPKVDRELRYTLLSYDNASSRILRLIILLKMVKQVYNIKNDEEALKILVKLLKNEHE